MNIYESIASIMQEVPTIGKEKTNKQQGFKYRGIDDVMNAFQPILAKNKVFIVPQVLEQTREERATRNGGNLIYSICRIKFTFYAEDGSFIEAITIGEGMDSSDKSTNKAMAVAMKYAMFQVFCIPTEEMIDPDSETPPPSGKKPESKKPELKVSEQMQNDIINKIASYAEIKNGNGDELLKYYLKKMKANNISELTQSQGTILDKEVTKLLEQSAN